jgi:uncharacterized protein (DUF2384 family)
MSTAIDAQPSARARLARQHWIDEFVASVSNQIDAQLPSDVDPFTALGTPDRFAERVGALIPPQSKWAEVIGAVWTTESLGNWLGVSRQAIESRRKARSLAAFTTADGHWVYADRQFRPDGTTSPVMAQVLRALSVGTTDWHMHVTWLCSPQHGLDSRHPIDVLAASSIDDEVVLSLAEQQGRWWAQ